MAYWYSALQAAVLALGLTCGCGGTDEVCPGHVDPGPGPVLTLTTSDGAPTIASVERAPVTNIGGGPASECMYYEVQIPDVDAGAGFATATIRKTSGVFIDSEGTAGTEPAPCEVTVRSVTGVSVTFAATLEYHHKASQHCVGNANCCAKSGLEWLGYVTFSPSTRVITF
jgi:hypothetical protein